MKNGATSFFSKLRAGLKRTQDTFFGRFQNVFKAHSRADSQFFEELEEVLLEADLGVHTVSELLESVKRKPARGGDSGPEAIRGRLKEEILAILGPAEPEPANFLSRRPWVILVIGVNGTGKTTTIAKLANRYRERGLKVLVGAGDTFRAAAVEQLEIWCERAGIGLVKHKGGGDPSAVVFDALAAAKAREMDVVLIDTAGRLHTKKNLMEELDKVKRICARQVEGAPHEILLVLDAVTGQNGLVQARQFFEKSGMTGIVLTKLDGSAKGGIVIPIRKELGVPVRSVGVGEGIDDLLPFSPGDFVDELFG
jgi:fused signal recognition particle receptor